MLQTWFLVTQTNFKKYKIIQNKNLFKKQKTRNTGKEVTIAGH